MIDWNSSVRPRDADGLWEKLVRLVASIPDRVVIRGVSLQVGSNRCDLGRQKRMPIAIYPVNVGATDSHFRVTSWNQDEATVSSSAATTVDLVVLF